MWAIRIDYRQAQRLRLQLDSLINIDAESVLIWPCLNCNSVIVAAGEIGKAACSHCHNGPQTPDESHSQPL